MKTICHYLFDAYKESPSVPALKFKKQRTWNTITWRNYYLDVESIASSLAFLGIHKGNRVVILSNTRHEWIQIDMGILCLGAITVPIYQSSIESEIEYIINESQPKILFLENALQIKKWEKLKQKFQFVEKVICIEPYSELSDEYLSWEEFLDLGSDLCSKQPHFLRNQIEQRQIDEDATIIYTSGTTGDPKGVLLQHSQICSEVIESFDLFDVNENDISLSFLPYAHVLGRVEAWGSIYKRFNLAFAESIDRIQINIQEVKPTLLVAVPRIFEKIHLAILSQVDGNPIKKKLFYWALEQGHAASLARQNGKTLPLSAQIQLQAAEKIVFHQLREKLGGRLRFAISGGAPLDKEIAQFFDSVGILILEGYGLSETTAAVYVNTPKKYKFGTVGLPIGDVKIKIAEDGEILIKSNKVMKQYFNNPDATREVFDGEYFKTGDIGQVLPDGFLQITDRKKDLIKTAGGKYIAPQKLEGLLRKHSIVSHALIYGDKMKYIVALVTLNEEETIKWAKARKISFQSFNSLSKTSEVFEEIKNVISIVNNQLSSHESIKNFSVLPTDFTIEEGELTPSLKVKRKFCSEKYHEQLSTLYK